MDPPNFFLYQLHSYDAPSNIPYVFVRRVVNNIHMYTACWLKSKYLRIYNENLQKQVPFFSKRGAHAQRAGPGSALDCHRILFAKYLPYYKDQILFGQFSSLCNVDCIISLNKISLNKSHINTIYFLKDGLKNETKINVYQTKIKRTDLSAVLDSYSLKSVFLIYLKKGSSNFKFTENSDVKSLAFSRRFKKYV